VARAFGLGLLHGALLTALGFYWLVPSLVGVARLPLPGALTLFTAFVLTQGGRTALIALLMALGSRRGFHVALAFPVALVAAELVYPLLFPWHLALFASPVLDWLQLAELGGPLFVSFWLAAANSAFAWAWQERSSWPRATRPALLGMAMVAGVTVVGHARRRAVERDVSHAQEVHVGIVQGNLAAKSRPRLDPASLYRAKTLELLSSAGPVDWIVWPETALSSPVHASELRRTLAQDVLGDSGSRTNERRIGVPLLLGMVVQADPTKRDPDPTAIPMGALTNSAILSDGVGRLVGRYDKRDLVPLGERAILASELPFVGDFLAPVNEFWPGPIRPAIALGDHRLGVSICYEDILHRAVRESVERTKPALLVNLTSDGWFAGSVASRMHLALARLRAVEHRRYFIRATTTGITSVIDPTGRVVWTLPETTAAAGVATVRWLEPETPYERVGDWPWAVMTALGLAAAVFRPRRSCR